MADTIEFKKRHRKVLRSCITKSLNELDTFLKKTPILREEIEVAWECVKPKYDELCSVNTEVLNLLLLDEETTEELLSSEMDQCEVYVKRFTTFRLKVEKLCEPVEDSRSVRSISSNSSQVGGNNDTAQDMEIEAVISFRNQMPSDTKVTINMCHLRDAIGKVCLAPLNNRRALILYFHNTAYPFSKTFCENLDTPQISELIERKFFFLGWDISESKFHSALLETLDETVVLSDLKPILTKKEAAAFLIVPIENTISLYSRLNGSKIGNKDIVTALKNTLDVLQKETEQESQLAELTKKNGSENNFNSIKFQMLMAGMLGDRDYDSFEYDEHSFLKQKIGFALYGPSNKKIELAYYGTQNEETVYKEEEYKTIQKIYKIIIKSSNEIAQFKDKVELSFITNCTEPLPKEKLKRAKKHKDYNPDTDFNPIPVFVLRKCRCSNNPCRVFIDHIGRVYTSWMEYLTKNKLPECEMIVPKNGRYEVNKNGEVLLTKHLSPACSIETKILHAADIGTAAGSIVYGGIFVAAAIPSVVVAPAALLAASVAGVGIGIYSVARSGYAKYDRIKHKEQDNLHRFREKCLLLDMQGIRNLLLFLVSDTLHVENLTIDGTMSSANSEARAVFNPIYEVVYKWIKNNETLSMLTLVQLESLILFFEHSVCSFRSCFTTVQDIQVQLLRQYQSSVMSYRHIKTDNKLLNETISRNDGVEVKGRTDVIKAFHNVPNKDEVFGVLIRSNKTTNEDIEFSAEGGQLKLNDVTIDMNTFTQMNEKQVNSFLTNLSSATTGETLPIAPSSSFCQQVASAFSGLGLYDPVRIATTCNSLLSLCQEDVKLNIVFAASELICHVGKPYIAWLGNANKFIRVIEVVVQFFSRKADELETQYNTWKETGDPQYYNEMFSIVDMGKANRCLKFFERCVKAGFSEGRVMVEKVVNELVDYFMVWFTKKYYEKLVNDERIESREAHSATVRVDRVECNVCGGHFFSAVKYKK